MIQKFDKFLYGARNSIKFEHISKPTSCSNYNMINSARTCSIIANNDTKECSLLSLMIRQTYIPRLRVSVVVCVHGSDYIHQSSHHCSAEELAFSHLHTAFKYAKTHSPSIQNGI